MVLFDLWARDAEKQWSGPSSVQETRRSAGKSAQMYFQRKTFALGRPFGNAAATDAACLPSASNGHGGAPTPFSIHRMNGCATSEMSSSGVSVTPFRTSSQAHASAGAPGFAGAVGFGAAASSSAPPGRPGAAPGADATAPAAWTSMQHPKSKSGGSWGTTSVSRSSVASKGPAAAMTSKPAEPGASSPGGAALASTKWREWIRRPDAVDPSFVEPTRRKHRAAV
mmetsp:Transcript_19929/g.68476  ORF Transcript_19929/g.68476 Transcript_19929/m.68476 type:complete len:225 (-) Transcript_19929:640-1314(-)